MPDSRLNGAEHGLQHSFMKMLVFNSLLMATAVTASYLPIRALPSRPSVPPAIVALGYTPVALTVAAGPLRLAGAWEVQVDDPRFSGVSSLAIERGRFLAVSDRGSVTSFDRPGEQSSRAWVADLHEGPGPRGKKWTRDAESLAPDPKARGWWVGFEQNHSLWLYDPGFKRALVRIDLRRPDWWDNRGAEGLIAEGGHLLVLAENGRDAMRVSNGSIVRLALDAGADVSDSARSPNGGAWLLLRSRRWRGIHQSIAPLLKTPTGYSAGPAMPVPKGPFDNFEGMAIEARPGGTLRFWLITDDGHRVMARTLLVALDYTPPARYDKSPATGAELLK